MIYLLFPLGVDPISPPPDSLFLIATIGIVGTVVGLLFFLRFRASSN